MPRTRNTTTTTSSKPGILSRLRHRQPAKVTTSEHTNPITGAHTRTKKTTTHPRGLGHHGHGGRGPLASSGPTATGNTHHTTTGRTTATTHSHHSHSQRKPSVGDKVSGAMMKLRGSLTGRPGVKVRSRQANRLHLLSRAEGSAGGGYASRARH